MTTNNEHFFCVILAGGKGRRLWPESRVTRPKQFIDFLGTGRTQLQQTYDRFAAFLLPSNIFVCTVEEYLPLVKEQLPELPDDHILAEPIPRNTAPSVAWANKRISTIDPDASIVVSPSDQLIDGAEAFQRNMLAGLDFVSKHEQLLTMGIRPTRPEPGYGYIQKGEPTDLEGVFHVQSFTEKPNREFAAMFIESREFYWNTGLFLSNVKVLSRTFTSLFPEVLRKLDRVKPGYSLADELTFIKNHYPAYPNVSMDLGVLERSENVCVMRCDFGWADLGMWHSVYDAMSHGVDENIVVDSQVMLEDCKNNIIKLPKDKIGVISGLDGYIVAEHGNVLLICPKEDSSSRVKKFASETAMKFGDEFV